MDDMMNEMSCDENDIEDFEDFLQYFGLEDEDSNDEDVIHELYF